MNAMFYNLSMFYRFAVGMEMLSFPPVKDFGRKKVRCPSQDSSMKCFPEFLLFQEAGLSQDGHRHPGNGNDGLIYKPRS